MRAHAQHASARARECVRPLTLHARARALRHHHHRHPPPRPTHKHTHPNPQLVLLPVSWPISKVLDIVLGQELGTYHSMQEFKKLIEIHVADPKAQEESGLTRDDQTMLTGVLEYKQKRVKDVFTQIKKVFMMERSQRLNFEMLLDVYKSGFTRIPVYEVEPTNIVGILYAKDLILVDPDDEIEVSTLLSFHGRDVCAVDETMTLDKVLSFMKINYTHMLLVEGFPTSGEGDDGSSADGRTPTLSPLAKNDGGVGAGDDEDANGGGMDGGLASPTLQARDSSSRRNVEDAINDDGVVVRIANSPAPSRRNKQQQLDGPALATPASPDFADAASPASLGPQPKVVTGIVTLEDVIEEIIQDEIVDETDNAIDVNKPLQTRIRHTMRSRDISKFFEALNSDHNSSNVLSPQEQQAVMAFLQMNVEEFKQLSQYTAVFKKLIATAKVIDEDDNDFSVISGPGGDDTEGQVLYSRGVPSSMFTLIMQGKVVIHAGSESFESELGPWSTLGNKALACDESNPYVPDFYATVSGDCRLLTIDRTEYRAALIAAKIDHVTGGRRFLTEATTGGAAAGDARGTRAAFEEGGSETASPGKGSASPR